MSNRVVLSFEPESESAEGLVWKAGWRSFERIPGCKEFTVPFQLFSFRLYHHSYAIDLACLEEWKLTDNSSEAAFAPGPMSFCDRRNAILGHCGKGPAQTEQKLPEQIPINCISYKTCLLSPSKFNLRKILQYCWEPIILNFGGFVELEFAELTQCAAEKQSSFGQSELSPRLQRHASWRAMIAIW